MARHRHPFPQTVTELALKLKVDRAHLSEVLNRLATPSVSLAKRIQAETNGVIKWTDLFEDPTDADQSPTSSLDVAI